MTEKMIFFDFDYTLAKTIESVWVWSPRGTKQYNGRTYRTVNPLEYVVLKLGNDEYLDSDSFMEFNKVNVERAKPLSLNIFLLNYFMLNRFNAVSILSARPQSVEKYIYEFLELHGVENFNKIKYKGVASSEASKKYEYIKEMVSKKKPKEVFIFDDSKKVIKYVKDNFYNDFKNIKLTSCTVDNKNSSTCLCF
jgi:hypothetical protein